MYTDGWAVDMQTLHIHVFLNIYGNMLPCSFSYATTKIQVLGKINLIVQTQIGLLLKEGILSRSTLFVIISVSFG